MLPHHVLGLLLLVAVLFALMLRFIGLVPWRRAIVGGGIYLVVAAAIITLGCGDTNIFVGGPTQINTQGNGSTPSPSPSGGSGGLVASVTIAEFGEKCPAGKQPAEDAQRQVRAGCSSAVTCNPRGADGKVLFDLSVTGVSPESFAQVSGQSVARFSQDDDNAFNGNVVGLSPGTGSLQCRVKGVTSEPWTFEVVP